MDDFVEMDELQRLEDEINTTMAELRHLFSLQSSGEDVADAIEERRKKVLDLRFKLSRAKDEMGEEYDRYKNNKRK